jgi:hypothetical protein
MAHPRESDFWEWAKPPSDTEDERCGKAVNVVRNAIRLYPGFATGNIDIFAQGSYRNGTNVKKDSDVDVCVCCRDVFFSELPPGTTNATFGIFDATYTYPEFKNEVEAALKSYLGSAAVSRGKKAFDLHENSYRVDADVVPAFEHRRYRLEGGIARFWSGTELRPDAGGRIVNWPQQNYDNGTAKNAGTGFRFKKLVRVLKRLRNEMAAAKVPAAEPIPSYLIECLVWNAPDRAFVAEEYTENLKEVLVYLLVNTVDDQVCSQWFEVNGLKLLFGFHQPWTRLTAQQFIRAAWEYVCAM